MQGGYFRLDEERSSGFGSPVALLTIIPPYASSILQDLVYMSPWVNPAPFTPFLLTPHWL